MQAGFHEVGSSSGHHYLYSKLNCIIYNETSCLNRSMTQINLGHKYIRLNTNQYKAQKPIFWSILAKGRDQPLYIFPLFLNFLSDFPNWGRPGSEGKHFSFHSTRSSTYTLDTNCFPIYYQTIKSTLVMCSFLMISWTYHLHTICFAVYNQNIIKCSK